MVPFLSDAQAAGRGAALPGGDGALGAGAPRGDERAGGHERRGQGLPGGGAAAARAPAGHQPRHPGRAEEEGGGMDAVCPGGFRQFCLPFSNGHMLFLELSVKRVINGVNANQI